MEKFYSAIFKKALELWDDVRKEDKREFDTPPDRFIIGQSISGNFQSGFCKPHYTLVWVFDGSFPPIQLNDSIVNQNREQRGMYYKEGLIQFCIQEENNQILWNHWMGKRYGKGIIYAYNSNNETLFPINNSIWIS